MEKDGTFWINNGTRGVCRFEARTERFKAWKNSNWREIDISKCNILHFYQDSKLRLWVVIAGQGLARLNKRDNTLKLFSFYKDAVYARKWKSTAWLGNITEDKNHLFWIATHDGLICFDTNRESYILFRDTSHQKESEPLHVFISHIYVDRKNMIWAGTWGAGLKKFNPQKKKWETYLWNLKHFNNSTRNIVHTIAPKSENELWIATGDSSLLIFNTLTKQFLPVENIDANASNILKATNLFEDGVGNLWCSGWKTFIKINTNNDVFHFQPINDNSKYGTGSLACNAFINYPYDSLLYIGTYYSKGIYALNRKTGVVKNYPYKRNRTLENINQFFLAGEKKF